MFGLILAVIGFMFLAITGHPPEAMITTSTLLFWWYVVWQCVGAVFLVIGIITILTTGSVGGFATGATLGRLGGAILGGLIGSLGGFGLAALCVFSFALKTVLLCGGSWLVMHSGSPSMESLSEFNSLYLYGGIAMVAIGAIFFSGRSSSSSDD